MVEYPALKGVGGWLVLPLIGLGLTLLLISWGVFNDGFWILDRDAWSAMTSPEGMSYHPGWAPYLLMQVVHISFIFGFYPALIVQYLRRRSAVRFIMPVLMLLNLVLAGAEYYACFQMAAVFEPSDLADASSALSRTVMAVLIWVPYFCLSKRVKITFSK